ncbi:MAG: hypothetical protein ACAF41_04695 [Leptolyngbya sp. BL-A-14]
MSEIANNIDTSDNYDAEQTVEEIEAGDRNAPTANVEADYEASKQFSTSEIDRTEAGKAAADEATSHQFAMPEPDDATLVTESTGNPDDYKQMAEDVTPDSAGAGNVSDAMVQKAMQKGRSDA